MFAHIQGGKRAWKWKQTRITKVISVDWNTEYSDWNQFKQLVIKSFNTKFDKVPNILRESDSGKQIVLLWAPNVQGSKDYCILKVQLKITSCFWIQILSRLGCFQLL